MAVYTAIEMLPPEERQWLEERAKKWGLSLDECVIRFLNEQADMLKNENEAYPKDLRDSVAAYAKAAGIKAGKVRARGLQLDDKLFFLRVNIAIAMRAEKKEAGSRGQLS